MGMGCIHPCVRQENIREQLASYVKIAEANKIKNDAVPSLVLEWCCQDGIHLQD